MFPKTLTRLNILHIIGEKQIIPKNPHKFVSKSRAVVAHTFNPSTREAETGGFLSLRPAFVYRVSSRTARATQKNPVVKNKQTNERTTQIYYRC